LSQLTLTQSVFYKVTEAFSGKSLGTLKPTDYVNATVDPTGVWMGIAL